MDGKNEDFVVGIVVAHYLAGLTSLIAGLFYWPFLVIGACCWMIVCCIWHGDTEQSQ